MEKKSKRKPLSFSTTIRNPYRIPEFLRCILPFEGQILTSEIIHEVIKNLLREKEYYTFYIMRNNELKRIYKSSDDKFNENQLEEIIKMSPQEHKEFGFKRGWDSRFDTWYKMIKEFGFIKYAFGEPITITSTGHMIVDAYLEEPSNNKKIQTIFLNALMRYQTNNPLRRNLNENVPLPLLLKVIKLFHDDPEENNAGLARHELPILICWPNNDAISAYEYIKNIRKNVGFTCSDEYIYDKCMLLLESTNTKEFKQKKICHEAVDEYIRKMRMSGLLSLRGNGRFLDINEFESEAVNYVITNYISYKKYDKENDYIDYMGSIDSAILDIEVKEEPDHSAIRKKTLYKYAAEFTRQKVYDELMLLKNNKGSKDDLLRFIKETTRLEFLTSIALVQNFKNLDVNPNYSVDDEGLPTYTAQGGMADIECFDKSCNSYFEVTLMCGKNDQVNNEIIPISRHLREAKKASDKISFSVLVAPVIHEDTVEAADWQKHKYNIDILTYEIAEFIKDINKYDEVIELLDN